MKRRIFAMALVALLALSGLWADYTADVDLTLDLGGETEAGWFLAENEPTLGNWASVKLANDSDQAFENRADDTVELWAAVKSNENVKFKLAVSGEAMSTSKVSTTIGIHAVGEEGGFGTVSADLAGAGVLNMSEDGDAQGPRVFAGKVTFSMDSEDFEAALSADDYSADITLTASVIE